MRASFRQSWLALVVGTLLHVGAAQAGPYSDLVIFGDSLSDTGNVRSLTQAGGLPAYPSFPGAEGRFSNGPVWVETLAAGLGLASAALPANRLFTGTGVAPIGAPQGNNYAYGGAHTTLDGSAGPTTGVFGQLAAWNGGAFSTSLSRTADADALYVIVAGGNDLRDARSANPGDDPAAVAARAAAAQAAAGNIINTMALLTQAGARHFLIASMPNLGRTPEALALGLGDESTDVTLAFNAALAGGAALLDAQFQAMLGIDINIQAMDLYGLGEDVYDDALNHGGVRFGITNVGLPCVTPGPFSGQYYMPDAVASGCDVAAYSDPLHPSAVFHRLIGELALATVVQRVPEPATLALLVLALLGLAASRQARPAPRALSRQR